MRFFERKAKLAGSLAAALMIGAPLALAATPTFAATMHDNDGRDGGYNHGGDRDNYRGGDRDSYRGGDRDNYRGDRDDHGMRYGKIDYRFHHKRFGHWGHFHGHRMWIVSFYAR